jgi:phosphoribosylglycinamide formyltransferase 1
MKQLAIFASGKGSNADNICRYFKKHRSIRVALIVTDRREAGVKDIAHKHGIRFIYIPPADWQDVSGLIAVLRQDKIDLIILAGFLRLIPLSLIEHFDRKIINIHPALLPRFGGKGMYGMHVHEAVKNSGVSETGITIHYVDEHYDNGDIIFSATTKIDAGDTPHDIATKIHELEMEHYPKVIEKLLS